MNRILATLLLLGLAGCTHGPRLKNFDAAYGPSGVASTVQIYGVSAEVDGELIAVEDEAIVIALQDRLVRVPYSVIRRASFEDAPHLGIASRRRPMRENRRQLALLSRFPQGLNGEVLTVLLGMYDQDEIETLP